MTRRTRADERAAEIDISPAALVKQIEALAAERDAVVKAVHVQAGGQIDAKDLLVELE